MNKEEYFYFNSAFNNVFFDGRFQSLPIYLDLEDPIRTELAAALSIPEDDFDYELGSCLLKTFQWDTGNIYQWHIENLNNWNTSNPQEAPPFTALLIAFSLAAEHMRKGDDDDYSASNYYQRLAEILGLQDESRKVKISRDGKYTEQFWHALNNWLLRNDFLYGRPTAKQINSWKYVSYSISQSLVRDGDRKTLHKLFNYSGFSGQEKINESEMKSYMHSWMATSGPSSWLKKLWGIPDLRDRVINAAINELDCWDDSKNEDSNNGGLNRTSKINWAVAIESFPKTRINLYLVTSISDDFKKSVYKISDDLLSKKILDGQKNEFVLTKLSGSNIGYFDITKININSLLLNSFDLQDEASEKIGRHETRAIILLIKDEGTSLYREVNRIVLFAKHSVICHKKMEMKVKNYLDKYAREGFEIKNAETIKGLPSDWILIQNVALVIIPNENEHEDLQALVPLSEGEEIYLSGGLKLTSGIWHSQAPPEIFASDGFNSLEISIKVNALDLENNDYLTDDYASDFLSTIEDLSGKNIIVVAKKNGKTKIEKDISFRDSNLPRKNLLLKDPELIYSAVQENKKFLYSAEEIQESKKTKPYIQGMICKNISEISNSEFDGFSGLKINRQFENETEWFDYDLDEKIGYGSNCIVRGYHVWICPNDPKLRAIDEKLLDKKISHLHLKMICSDCNFEQIVKRKAKSGTKLLIHSEGQKPKITRNVNRKISCDIVYDALCYLGRGSMPLLTGVVSEAAGLPWLVNVITQNLIDLGHIDQAISFDGFVYENWSCSPPSLVITGNSKCYLSGFRSLNLIRQVKSIFNSLNCDFEEINSEDNLSTKVYLWHLGNQTKEFLEKVFENVTDAYGRNLLVTERPENYLVNILPFVKELLSEMSEAHVENNSDLEKFDLLSGKWTKSEITGPGAYRTTFAGRRYVYFDGAKFRECGYELSKLFAARQSKIFLHHYDESAKEFSALLGCQPPGLYRRTLASCSGTLPVVREGRHIYKEIPKNIASIIMAKLYS
jgi:hypothetical protein